eukprot:TRINITY_DN8410_c0_g2_i3.p1 TRINITY_DN8410_c0_g2~~TRINITY_DN8410_c0_g2_i3.p1  ORF type:complete len:150 (-),score=20.76 TRINITY_DN8410_c0_g2_i3:81-530(-)
MVNNVIATNLAAPIHTILLILPDMIKRKSGHIVGISSLAAFRGLKGASVYGATKAGLSNFLESIRIEESSVLTITDVKPGFVDTPAIENINCPKPFLLSSPQAATIILHDIAAQRSHSAFPFPLFAASYLSLILPNFLYDLILLESNKF